MDQAVSVFVDEHVPGFEDASLGIHEWDPLVVKDKSRFRFIRRQVVVHFAESSDSLECCHPKEGVTVRFIYYT